MDRRTTARVKVDLAVEERTEGALYFQRATDLSQSGVYLAGTLSHPPGTEVELELALPGAPLRVRGEVAPTGRDVGMAVRFLDLDAAARARLAAYIHRPS